MNVLVISDDSVLGKAWSYLLEERGYNVFMASNGPDAIRIGKEHDLHLVMFDADDMLRMAQGLTTISVIKNFFGEVPILVLSPWSLNREETLARGATICVAKPVDYGTVLRLVDMMTSRISNRRWSMAEESA